MKLAKAALVLFMAVSAYAADLNGKWKGQVEGPDGQMDLVFTFKVDGDKVTGTVTSQMGEAPITEGKLTGDSIAFTVETDQFKVTHTGTVSGDEMKLKADVGDRTLDMTLHRAKS